MQIPSNPFQFQISVLKYVLLPMLSNREQALESDQRINSCKSIKECMD